MKWRFRPKLTLLYSVLFLVIFVPTILIVRAAVIDGVSNNLERELQASGAVFDRILTLRGSQLEETATVLAGDFGFRTAVATQDSATVVSALNNIAKRLGGIRALVVDLDGLVFASTDRSTGQVFAYNSLLGYEYKSLSSAGMLADAPHLIVSTPIMTPVLTGWVIFALELDRSATLELEALSSVPLTAVISQVNSPGITAYKPFEVYETETDEGATLSYVIDLQVAEGSAPISLNLSHSLALARQPYDRMLFVILGLGVMGVALLGGGSWWLAGRVTQPLIALTNAVERIKEGRKAELFIDSADEFGDLANGFNRMSAEILSREKAITHMALHDTETGLPNRHQLVEQLKTVLEASDSGQLVLLAVRIKRFTNVRAAIGFDLTAQLLKRLARRLDGDQNTSSCARLTTDTLSVYRILHPDEDVKEYCDRLRNAISAPVRLGEHAIDVNFLIGAARAEQTDAAETLIRSAEIALEQAVADSQSVAVFDIENFQDPAATLTLMSEMLVALQSGHITLHYQPKVDIRTGHINEAEALLRWNHPDRGFITPDFFVGLAEETGHIAHLSQWVVDMAMQNLKAWLDDGLDIAVGINMSGRLLADQVFTDYTINALGRYGVDPSKIVLEITETAVMDNPERALEQLARLRKVGIALSIDDYGTGLSSLSYLKDLPVNELKIDKCFVLNLATNEQDRVLVRSTTDLAHSLGLKVTAEGVEDAASYALLQLYGCDSAQGYFMSKAVPEAEFRAFTTEWNSCADPILRLKSQGMM